MKISNSKKELARIISKNGGWRDRAEWAAQDSKMDDYPLRVCLYVNKPKINKGDTRWSDEEFKPIVGDGIEAEKQIPNWHQTILSRAEYFHLYPAPDADGWIEWLSDELPVAKGTIIDVKYSDGDELHGAPCGVETENLTSIRGDGASAELFGHSCFGAYIIAYRLHKPEQSKPEFCESVERSIPEPDEQVWTNPPSIEQLAADYRNKLDYAERKQKEADDAKADADSKLKALELAGEALGLLVTPITAKQEPELVIADWRDLQLGDEVEYLDGVMKNKIGMVGAIDKFNHDSYTDRFFRIRDGYNFGWPTKWRFIRRP